MISRCIFCSRFCNFLFLFELLTRICTETTTSLYAVKVPHRVGNMMEIIIDQAFVSRGNLLPWLGYVFSGWMTLFMIGNERL